MKNLKNFICLIATSMILGCGMVDSVKDGMNETSEGIRKSTLQSSLKEMMSEENTANVPNPSLMMPYGDSFAKNATAQELVQLNKLWLGDIAYGMPMDFDPSNPEHILNVTKEKTAKLVGLQIIAGLAPQATIDNLIREQITDGGRYQDIAYVILMNRASFIRKVLLEQDILLETLYNKGKIRVAIEHIESLEKLYNSAHKDRIQVYIDVPAINFTVVERLQDWKPSVIESMWSKVSDGIENDLQADENDPEVKNWKNKIQAKLK